MFYSQLDLLTRSTLLNIGKRMTSFFHSQIALKKIALLCAKQSPPEHQIAVQSPHSALWVKRNLMDKRGKKTRDFT